MKTAATVKRGERFEFLGVPVESTRVLESGRYKGMIFVKYARPFDDSKNDWRIYPPEYLARF